MLLLLFVLAVTLPFIGQAVHIDGHLFIEWAQQELSHPFWQHIPNYDYFGYHYDQFHDTHPRLQSTYLALFIWLDGGVNEKLLHLVMIPFPMIAGVSMYFLARRFKVHQLLATLLFLSAPAFLANTHLLMTDVPGIALWLAGLTFFIYGVDSGRRWQLALSAAFFSMCVFDYYQGLSVLPLALLYVLMYRKMRVRTLMPLAVPALLFGGYVAAHFVAYGQLPTFSYPFGLPIGPLAVVTRVRGVVALVGGALLFPVVPLLLFAKQRKPAYVAAIAAVIGAVWVAAMYAYGYTSLEAIFLLPLMLAAGVAIVWMVVEAFWSGWRTALKGIGSQDDVFLAVWFLGTLFYCAFLLPYPSPRYMIPLIPPLAIFTTRVIQRLWGGDRRKFMLASGAIVAGSTFLALSIAISENDRANNNPVAADWVAQELAGQLGTHWYVGGLGYQYYLAPQGFSMLLIDRDPLPEGDLVAESVLGNRWKLKKWMTSQLEVVDQKDFPRSWWLDTENMEVGTSWFGQLNMVIPYGFSGDFLDRVYIYKVVGPPDPNVQEDEDS